MESIRLLLVEDDEAFSRYLTQLLEGARPAATVRTAGTLAQALDLASRHAFDAAVLDLGLPDSAGLDSIVRFCSAVPGVPAVVLTGIADESLPAAALKAGAQDYLPKSELDPDVLLRTLRHAVERHRALTELRQKDEELRALFDGAPMAMLTVDHQGLVRTWNAEAERMFGWRAEELIGQPLPPVTGDTPEEASARIDRLWRGEAPPSEELVTRRRDGTRIDVIVAAAHLFDAHGVVTGGAFMIKDISRRRRVERVLRESERRYRLMFEHNPNPMWVFNARTFTFLAVNDAAVAAYGYSRDEFLAMSILDIRPREDIPAVLASLGDGREPSTGVFARHLSKDGTIRYVRVSGHPLEFDGQPARLALVTDITARHLAEERERFLNEASGVMNATDLEATLAAVPAVAVRTMADLCAVLLLSPSGDVERVRVVHRDPDLSAAVESISFSGLTARAWRPPRGFDEAIATRRTLRVTAADGPVGYFAHDAASAGQFALLRLRGAVFIPLESGGRLMGVLAVAEASRDRPYDDADLAVFEDMGRRLALTLDNARLFREARELFDGGLTGNFVARRDGTLVACNPAFTQLFQLAAADVQRGADVRGLFGEDEEWARFVAAVEQERAFGQREMDLRTFSGVPVHVLIAATAMLDSSGALVQLRGQVYDLTQHKQLEEQYGHSQKLEAVGRLAGGIAHDFNNLLLVIIGQAERLRRQIPVEAEGSRALEAIEQAAGRAAGLTQQLLAFSRRQVLSLQPLDVNGVIRGVHSILERVIGEDITCTLRLTEGLAAVMADSGRLEQALLNLAVNARDAMPQGGGLTLSTERVDIDEVYSRQHLNARPGPYVMIAVSDTGCGMDPETRRRVFEPFFTTKPQGKGTGLGLSTVYGIVKQIGGYIWVYSEPGFGTSFKIYLPAVAEPARPLAAASTAPQAASGEETLLLVEDEDGVRELLKELLGSLGYRVFAASCASEALQISASIDGDIALLVTDVVMPQMGGRELAQRLLAQRPDTRVLFLSGYTDDAIAQHGVLEAGAAFLQKPFATADLARKVRDVLSAPRH
jgi:two-component system cell cycle sensor histidine kinase/response regulator CckA